MRLSEIWIYPVKSLGGIRLTEAQVREKGLQYDRRWMVVDEHGNFLTQRTNSKMALLDASLDREGLVLSNRYEPEKKVYIPLRPLSGQAIEVKVWKDVVTAMTICDEADVWLTQQLGKSVKLVMMSGSTKRKMDPQFASKGELVSFADDFPYLLISEASLADLNRRLAEPVKMNRFRPNFVISGTDPFEEDSWRDIRIGNLHFQIASTCERCVVVTINQDSGSKGPEPLKTLATFRKSDRKIMFGQNLIGKQYGIVREGDIVEILTIKKTETSLVG